uniref:RING-type domain-containing protein n=1 Tax=Macrostomum lignano TaxID=282301 RepID=A0A1I8JJS7_9PLAT
AMSEAKRIRLADPSELSAAPASSSAVESEPSPQLMELVQDCTCPVCKEIFTEPVALVACGHAFCRRCYEKLCRKCATTETGIGGGFAFLLAPPSSLAAEQQRRVACPAECLVRALMLVKAPQQTVDASLPTPGDVDRSDGCCSASTDCWRRRAVRCTDCGVASCRAHHESALASLRSSAAEVAAAGATFASDESAGVGPLRRLTDMRLRLPNLRRALADRLTGSVRPVRQAAEASLDRRQHLAGLVHRLESVTAAAAAVGGDAIDASYAEMLTLKSRLTAELAEARSLHPALRVEEPIGLQEDLERGLDACLDELTVRLYALPYESLARASTSGAPLAPVRLAPIAHHRTRPRRPWCLRLLKNVSGLRLLNGRL